MNFDYDHILPEMIRNLWRVANTPPVRTEWRVATQKRALRLLLVIRGGVDFVVSQPETALQELGQRGVWQGRIILQELAKIELQRRRLLVDLTDVERRSQEIVRDLRICAMSRVPDGKAELGYPE